jgi:hypothetical protein
MIRFTCFLIGILMLAGCRTNQLSYVPSGQLIAYNSADLPSVEVQVMRYKSMRGQVLNVSQYPFFIENSFGKDWLQKPKHRAIAIGYPPQCATYNGRWHHSKMKATIRRTLQDCLNRMAELGRHLGKKCGCRLAALDERIFVNPDDLPFRKQLPAIALVKDEKGRKEILGYALTTGRTGQKQPFNFYTQNDKKVCDGEYNLASLSMKGKAHLDCFGGKIKGPALFKVAGFRDGQAYGTALVNAGDNQLILVYGLPGDEFEKRRAELLSQ